MNRPNRRCSADRWSAPSVCCCLQAILLCTLFLTSGCGRKDAQAEGKIFFCSMDRSEHPDLYWVSPSGGPVHRVAPKGRHRYAPQVSHDGRKLIYSGGPGASDLWMLDLATFDERSLVDEAVYGARWSPDDASILYCRSGKHEVISIHRLDLARGTEVRIGEGAYFCWSPDGSKILYQRKRRSLDGPDLWIMNRDGSMAKELVPRHTGAEGCLSWSPNREYLAFYTRFSKQPGIHILSLGSQRQTMLLPRDRLDFLRGCTWSWSPDSRSLVLPVFGGEDLSDVKISIGVIDVNSGKTRLLTGGFRDTDPCWGSEVALPPAEASALQPSVEYVAEVEELNRVLLSYIAEAGVKAGSGKLMSEVIHSGLAKIGAPVPPFLSVLMTLAELRELQVKTDRVCAAYLGQFLTTEEKHGYPQLSRLTHRDAEALEKIRTLREEIDREVVAVMEYKREHPHLFRLMGPVHKIPRLSVCMQRMQQILTATGASVDDLHLLRVGEQGEP